MEVASADLLHGQSPALESPIKTTEVLTAANSLPLKEARFSGDFLKWPITPYYKNPLHFVFTSLSGSYGHLQPRPDRLLLQLRRGSRSPEPLQAGAAGKRLRSRLKPWGRSESQGQCSPNWRRRFRQLAFSRVVGLPLTTGLKASPLGQKAPLPRVRQDNRTI